jgi:nitroreductase
VHQEAGQDAGTGDSFFMTHAIDHVNKLKHAPHVEGVLPIFHTRWSPRSFADREVEPATLARVFEAARWAASSSNEQPWRWVVGVRNTPTYDQIFDALVPGNQAWAKSAPVLVVGTAKSTFTSNGSPNRVALYDLGAATSYATLEAAALGLVTHQMGGFSQDAARKNLGIPDDYLFGSVIAIGYQGEPEALANEKLQGQEMSPRKRKPLSEIVFSAWDVPAKLD